MHKILIVPLLGLALGLRPALASDTAPLPAPVRAQMTSGRKLLKRWVSPSFDLAQGFRIGHADLALHSPYGDIVDYLPVSFGRLAKPDSPNVLTLTVTELSIKERAKNSYCAATLGLEGQVLDRDGNTLLAFATREEYNHGAGAMADCRGAVDTIVNALAKELGLPAPKPVRFQRRAAAAQPTPPAVTPAQPAPPAVTPAQPDPARPAAPAKPKETTFRVVPEDPAARGHHF